MMTTETTPITTITLDGRKPSRATWGHRDRRPLLEHVMLKVGDGETTMVATDSYCLVELIFDTPGTVAHKGGIFISRQVMVELEKHGGRFSIFDEGGPRARRQKDGRIFDLEQEVEGKLGFPQYQSLIPKADGINSDFAGKFRMRLDPTVLNNAADALCPKGGTFVIEHLVREEKPMLLSCDTEAATGRAIVMPTRLNPR